MVSVPVEKYGVPLVVRKGAGEPGLRGDENDGEIPSPADPFGYPADPRDDPFGEKYDDRSRKMNRFPEKNEGTGQFQ